MSVGKLHIFVQVLAVAALAMLFSACTTAPTEADKPVCAKADWYELGRLDGAQGSPTERFSQHQKDCAKNFNAEWETMYNNGRNAGLVEYCDPKNAYELGRMGGTYYYVCPSTVEQAFLASYKKGQQARELELQNQKLDEQIDQVSQKLTQTSSSNEQEQLAAQLDELKKTRAKNEQELTKIIAK